MAGDATAARHLPGSLVDHLREATAFTTVSDITRANVSLFDKIHTPHLLHRDLWTFNLLVMRGHDGPTITGILDTDRALWGDPMADCIMFLLPIWRDEAEWQHRLSAFYDDYGTPYYAVHPPRRWAAIDLWF